MNFIILTNGNDFCTKLLKNFNDLNDIKIYVEFPLSLSYFRLKNEKTTLFLFIKLLYRCATRMIFLTKFIIKNKSYWCQFKFIGAINSINTIQFIKSQKIDVIFLAGMSILKKDILASAKFGIYNCHPAIIPNVRGLDVVYHSVTNLIPPIISIHRVDNGIDTGNLIQAFKVQNNLLSKTNSYFEINENILDFAAFKFHEFIIHYKTYLRENKVDLLTLDLPILSYCRKVQDKDLNLFFKCLNKIEKID